MVIGGHTVILKKIEENSFKILIEFYSTEVDIFYIYHAELKVWRRKLSRIDIVIKSALKASTNCDTNIFKILKIL